ncbi:MAG: threonylcarbamoyl-AMP synthase [Bacteroidales bacterium]|nr:threonylcarbamoyl-AMP synthase [Bacteroidales bacterium]
MKEDILNAVKVLHQGGVILYPTDTIWGIGCDATNNRAVQKVHKIKGRLKSKSSFIILLEDEQKISQYVKKVPEILWDLLKSFDTPTTVVYPGAKNLARSVIASDGSVGIRVTRDPFCKELLKAFGKPVTSTSANLSGERSPLVFKDIPEEILNSVDYAVTTNREKLNKAKASTIIKLKENGEFEILRQ